MKKTLITLLTILLMSGMLVLSGCGGEGDPTDGTTDPASESVSDTEGEKRDPVVTLKGNDILDYSLVVSKEDQTALKTVLKKLNDKIKEVAGEALTVVITPTGKDIVIQNVLENDPTESTVFFEGDSLIIRSGHTRGATAAINELIKEIVPKNDIAADYSKSFSVTLNGRITGNTYDENGNEKGALDYKVGETVKFKFSLTEGSKPISCNMFEWVIMGDGIVTKRGTASGATGTLELDTKLEKAGAVFVNVKCLDKNGKVLNYSQFNGGAGVSVTEIKQTYKTPDDFDAVWADLVGRLDKISLTPTVKKEIASGEENPKGGKYAAYDDKKYVAYDIELPCVSGVNPVRGILTMPRDKVGVKGSLDIKIQFQGYSIEPALPQCEAGTAVFYVNIHGLENGREQTYYYDRYNSPVGVNGGLKDFAVNDGGKTKIEDYYFYGVMLRDIQAVRYLFSLPEYNGSGLSMYGGSMGAMQSVTVASVISRGLVDGKMKSLKLNVPWCSDVGPVRKADSADAMKYNEDSVTEDRIPRYWGADAFNGDTLYNYFDIANHIGAITCPIEIEGRFGDYYCPARSIFVLYNNATSAQSVELTMILNGTHGEADFNSAKSSISK